VRAGVLAQDPALSARAAARTSATGEKLPSIPRVAAAARLARRVLIVARRGAMPPGRPKGGRVLYYSVVFFIVALVAALFGFGGIAAGAAEIAKILFFIFLVLFVVSLVWGLINGRMP
jgi:uncharacterized membrane protein YtjA (UPF0391 family)